jgi:uncharacterized protein (TIGR02246 family)
MTSFDTAPVQAVLDKFAAAYSRGDLEGAMSLISSDPDVVLCGTGTDEVCLGPDQIRTQMARDLTQADEVRLALGTSRISGRGDVAWAFSEPVVTASVDRQQITMPVRMSVVLVKGNGQWLIHNAHLSVAFAAQEEGHSFANA